MAASRNLASNIFFCTRRLLCTVTVASRNKYAMVLGASRNTYPSQIRVPVLSSAGWALFSTRSGATSTSTQAKSYDILAIVRELISRIEEQPILRSPSSIGSSAEATMTNNLITDIPSLSPKELSSYLCKDYHHLPPISFCSTNPNSSDATANNSSTARESILDYLATQGATSDQRVASAVNHYFYVSDNLDTNSNSTDRSLRKLQMQLTKTVRQACTPCYETLCQNLLEENAKEGMVFLVKLREDLRQYMQRRPKESEDELLAHLKEFDEYLRNLFSTWFSPGMLEMRRITYEGTSASIMEEIATKEAVHPLKSLDDLRSRLGPDRRVFAAFHPLLPNKPLVFIHVALSNEIPSSMNQVLVPAKNNRNEEGYPCVATFYSISATQSGLAGVDLGHFLIQRVVWELQQEFPHQLKTFVTLSPIPRFRKWLEGKIMYNKGGHFVDDTLLTEEDIHKLRLILDCSGSQDVYAALLRALKEGDDNRENANDLPQNQHVLVHKELKPILMKLAARYLVLEKHHGKPLDGVARFHVGNGAEMYRLNYMADASRKGLHNSAGMMINYRYNLNTKEGNQALYQKEYHISVCNGVSEWSHVTKQ